MTIIHHNEKCIYFSKYCLLEIRANKANWMFLPPLTCLEVTTLFRSGLHTWREKKEQHLTRSCRLFTFNMIDWFGNRRLLGKNRRFSWWPSSCVLTVFSLVNCCSATFSAFLRSKTLRKRCRIAGYRRAIAAFLI